MIIFCHRDETFRVHFKLGKSHLSPEILNDLCEAKLIKSIQKIEKGKW